MQLWFNPKSDVPNEAYFRKLRSKLEVKRHYNHTWGQLKHEKDRQLKVKSV